MLDIGRFINKYVDKNTLIKGKRIFLNQEIKMKALGNMTYRFEIPSESYDGEFYDVELDFDTNNELIPTCNCPQYLHEEYCKHVTASLLHLKEVMKVSGLTYKKTEYVSFEEIQKEDNFNQKYKKPYLYEWEILDGIQSNIIRKIRELVGNRSIKIIEETQIKSLTATVNEKKGFFTVEIQKNDTLILAKCDCNETIGSLPCIHTRAVLLYVLYTKKEPNYLDQLIDIEPQKIALLATMGIKLDEPEADYFEFYFSDSDLKIRPKAHIVNDVNNWSMGKTIQKVIAEKKTKTFEILKLEADNYIFVLKIYKETPIIRWEVYPINGTLEAIESTETKLSGTNYNELKTASGRFYDFIYSFTPKGVVDFLRVNNLLSNYFYNDEYELRHNISNTKLALIKQFFIDCFKTNINILGDSNQFFIKTGNATKPKAKDLHKISFSEQYFSIHLAVIADKAFVKIKPSIVIKNEIIPLGEFSNYANIMLVKDNMAHIVKNEIDWKLLQDFSQNPEIIVPKSEAFKLYKNYLLPIRNLVSLDLPEGILPETIAASSTILAVRLKEMEPNFLLFEPIIKYNGIEATLDDDEIEVFHENKLQIVERDLEQELFLKNTVQSLHPKFESQGNLQFYYLTFVNALAKNWFFDSIKILTENNIEIYGQKQLTKFKYNANKPKIDIKGGSGIDWFDLKIKVSYGDQLVPLKALKLAILNKQDFVQLSDGSMGLLPEDWLKKFRSLFQLGTIKNEDNLQVSKWHYTLIDELHGAISEQSILDELALKKAQLNQLEHINDLKMPKNIQATLRPYQLAGFNWFNQLHEIGWGGCLADDMGLGKTLQTLCYFQEQFNKNKKFKALIVCPTSLMYNWQAEIDKFTKGLEYVIYHGTVRDFPDEKKAKYNIFITSYGTLRNDIEKINKVQFDVTVLDESQSIKNPTSQVTKAVALINTKLRFILSGTPVQNNTFDLFAQLNFVNPGLLGTQEFFKTEFANAIDKFGDKAKSEQLRKMVYPFILRRTKEQVAKDLPDKTETILFCEMDTYQQKVYNAVKEDYRYKIMNSVEELGVQKSAFLILEGLNKLRQICDCPSLIFDKDKIRFKQESIKLEEIMREIEENISNHKMLIFSQFLGMLDLVKVRLEAKGIKYIYLDGSTPAKDRAKLVNNFQTDVTIQIFLISLKAGGVGLNLTAADYVYVLDPWWNPAVEDQAIDRTHRIGQTKKIFAYKLICKNSIEEKIIQLQAKKKSLAKELISEDVSFVKKLTKEDVAWLLG
jgi:SNF2 family DNA or RNA helicase